MSSLRSWLKSLRALTGRPVEQRRPCELAGRLARRLFRPVLEALEDRIVPDAVLWNVATSGNWNVAANWLDTTNGQAQVPGSGDNVTINQTGITVTVSDTESAGTLTTASGALLAVTAGSLTIGSTATLTGGVDLSGGTLSLGGATTLGGTSQWSGGTIAGSGALTNGGTLDVAASSSTFTLANALNNTGTIDVQSGTLSITGTISQVSGTTLTGGTWDVANNATLNFGTTNNLTTNQANVGLGGPNAVFTQFETVTNDSGTLSLTGGAGYTASGNLTISGGLSLDTGTLNLNNHALTIGSNGNLTLGSSTGLSGESQVTNSGTFAYDGSGALTVGANFNNQGGTIAVQSGTVVLAGRGTSTGGTFNVNTGGVLDLTGGNFPTFTGSYTGSGGGQVQLNSGQLQIGSGGATFDLSQGLFQWAGGAITTGSASFTNTGFVTLSNANGTTDTSSGTFINQGTIVQTGAGPFAVNSGGLDNQAGAVLNVQSSGGLTGSDTVTNEGTFKMTGSGTATVAVNFDLQGGTVEVDSGNLVLQSRGTSTGGNFDVASGATLDLTGGQFPTFTGSYTGSGSGSLVISGGTLTAGTGGATFNVPTLDVNWSGGTINAGASGINLTVAALNATGNESLSNTLNLTGDLSLGGTSSSALGGSGQLNILGGSGTWTAGTLGVSTTLQSAATLTLNNPSTVTLSTVLTNAGTLNLTGTGTLSTNGNGQQVVNQAGGVIDIESDTSVTAFNTSIINSGLIEKTGGTGISTLNAFDNPGGTIDVETGTLALAGTGGEASSNGGTFAVAQGATLDLTGGTTSTYSGAYTGDIAGTVQLASGTLNVPLAGATFNLTGTGLTWTGGTLQGGGTTNHGLVTVSGSGTETLETVLTNSSTLVLTGTGTLNTHGNGQQIVNESGGVIDIESDTSVTAFNTSIINSGLVEKTGGSGTSTLNAFDNPGGTIDVETGTLALAGTGGEASSNGGTFAVAQRATLDLTGGTISTYSGAYTGDIAGTVQLASGTLNVPLAGATFNLTGTGLTWTGGTLQGGGTTNHGLVTVSGSGTETLETVLTNSSTLVLTGTGTLNTHGNGQQVVNRSGGVINIESDTSVTAFNTSIINSGLVEKTGGSGTSTLNAFDNTGGTIDVETGTIALAGTGGEASNNGGTFVVAQGASLDLTGGTTSTYSGSYTGDIAGTVQLASGTLNVPTAGITFNLTGTGLTWTGGTLQGGGATNLGLVTVSGSGTETLETVLTNSSTLVLTGTGTLNTHGNGQQVVNQTGGVIDIESDTSVTAFNTSIINSGLVEKTGGTRISTLNAFDNTGGTIDVETGTVALAGTGGEASNNGGTFDVVQGATLDLTGGQTSTYSGTYIGSGAGQVLLQNGKLNLPAAGATFDLPGSLFQWTGGTLSDGGGGILNDGALTLAGSATKTLGVNLINNGTINVTGSGTLDCASNPTFINNDPGALIDFQSDAPVTAFSTSIANAGTIEKTGGTGTTSLPAFANSGGTIDVLTGTIALAGNAARGGPDTGGIFNVVAGAVLDLTGGTGTVYSGTYTGTGAGVVQLGSGTLQAGSGGLTLDFTGGGFLWSGGSIDGSALTNEGQFTFSAGSSVSDSAPFTNSGTVSIDAGSVLTVNTTYTQTSTGTLAVQLGGTHSGQFGQLVSSRAVQLDGTLAISLVNGYSPANGDAITVLQYASETGTFAKFILADHAGIGFTAAVKATSVVLNAVAITSDLAVQSIDSISPAGGVDGQNETVKYTVINNGSTTPVSSWVDSVFLSADGTLDSSAVLLGRVPHSGAVTAGGTYHGTLTAALPGVLPGSYSVIVETDSQGVVPDVNRANNLLVSSESIATTTASLTVGGSVSGTIRAGQDLYFQLDLTSGSDVVLTAQSAVSSATNLYLSESVIPDPGNFDQAAVNSPGVQQQLLLSNPQTDTYFLLLQGTAAAAGGQTFTLSAAFPSFGLSGLGVSSGGNAGSVTVPLLGAGFSSGLTANLHSAGGQTVVASRVLLSDSQHALATFDLQGVSPGVFDVQAEQGGITSALKSAFMVTVGRGANLQTEVIVPSAIRPGTPFQVTVQYTNAGDEDLPVPLFTLEANTDNPVWAGNFQTQADASTDIPFLGINPNGPSGGVLHPGESHTISFNSVADGSITEADYTLFVEDGDSTDPVDYTALEQQIQPAEATAQWAPAFQALTAQLGSTFGQFIAALARATDEAHLLGVSVPTEKDVLDFMIQQQMLELPGAVATGTLFLGDTNHPLGSMVISLTDTTSGQGFSAQSFYDGRFAIFGVPAGTYDVTVASVTEESLGTLTISANAPLSRLQLVVQSGQTLSGTIVSALTGEPIADATVIVQTDTQSSAETDANGHYTLPGLPAGTYSISVEANGFVADSSQSATIQAGQAAVFNDALDIGGTVTGKVLNTAGTPAAGADVQAIFSDGTVEDDVTTAADGTFTLNGLPPGTYQIVVGGGAQGSATPVGFGAGSVSGVTVLDGATTGPITVALSTTGSIQGTITDVTTRLPLANVVLATSPVSFASTPILTDANGDFILPNLPPGQYEVFANLNGYASGDLTATVSAGQATTLNFALQLAGVISGQVVRTDGSPVSGASVSLIPASGSELDVTADVKGNFSFTDLPDGQYTVEVGAANGQFISPQSFTLSGAKNSFQTTLTLNSALISGQVIDATNAPVSGATVALFRSGNLLETTTTDSSGQYQFDVVSSGPVDIVAFAPSIGFLVDNNVAVTAGQGVTAPELVGGSASVDLTVQGPASEPQAVSDALVLIHPTAFPELGMTAAVTDSNGRAVIGPLAAGNYLLDIAPPSTTGLAALRIPVTVGASIVMPTATLDSAGSIQGTVTDETGAVVVGAVVTLIQQETGLTFSVETAADGTWSLGQLPAGTYNATVVELNHQPVQLGPITLVAGASMQLNTTMPTAGATLSGIVTDGSGNPLFDVDVNLLSAGGVILQSTTTGDDGSYTLPFLPAGIQQIQVVAPGFVPTKQQFAFAADSSNTANFSLGSPDYLVPSIAITESGGSGGQILFASPQSSSSQSPDLATVSISQAHGNTRTPQAIMGPQMRPNLVVPPPLQFIVANPPTVSQAQKTLGDRVGVLTGLLLSGDPCAKANQALIVAARNAFLLLNDAFDQWDEKYKGAIEQVGGADGGLIVSEAALVAAKAAKAIFSLLQLISKVNSLTMAFQSKAASQITGGTLQVPTGLPQIPGADPTSISALQKLSATLAGQVATLELFQANNVDFNAQQQALSTVVPITSAALKEIGNALGKNPALGVAGSALSLQNDISGVQKQIQELNDAVKQAQADTAGGLQQYLDAQDTYNQALQRAQYAINEALSAINDCHNGRHHHPGKPPNSKPHGKGTGKVVFAHDPNELIGPAGVGTANILSVQSVLPYTIDFENDPTKATAPAQIVTVTEQLDPNLDLSTFQFGTIGFGNTSIIVPTGLSSFSTRIDATATVGVLVDLSANLNVQTGLVTWTFTSIDPTTLDVPVGNHSLEGFLPPDTNPPLGDGFVTYTVEPKATAASGTVISAQASVVFDTNAAIPTNTAVNSLDAALPPDQLALQPPTQAVAGGKATIAVVAQGSNGQVDPLFTGLATIALAGGPKGGTLAGTLTAPFVNGVATFSLSASAAGTYTLLAASTSDLPAATAMLTVVAAPKFKVTLSPASGGSGSSFTATISALLGGKPDTGYVGTVVLTSSDPQAASINGSFTNASNGTLTLPIVLDSAGKQTVTVADSTLPTDKATSNAVTVGGLALTLDHFLVSGIPSTDVLGVPHTVTITAVNKADQTVTSFTGSVTLTSSDGSVNIPVNFTATNKGVAKVSVVFTTPGAETLTAAGGGKTGTETNIVVVSPATHLGITTSAPAITAGKQVTLTVTGLTAKNKTDTLFADTLQVTTSDPLAQVELASNTGGVETCTITFDTAGTQTITVTDLSRPALKAPSQKVIVTAAAPSQLVVTSAPLFAVASSPVAVTVTAEDAFGNAVLTGFTDKVTLSTGQSATFSKSDKGKHVFAVPLSTAGTVALTASDSTHTSVAASSAVNIDVVSSAVAVSTTDPTGGSGQALIVIVPAGGGTIQLMATNAAGTSIQVTEIIGRKKTTFGPFTLTTADHIVVYGQTGNDVIEELAGTITGSPKITVPAVLLDGSGTNTLSAAGSSAGNVLVGGQGKDSLTGGSGHDILIGGGGADTLKAGSGGDVLIGGGTTFDANLIALASLLAEWSSGDSYQTRVQDLFGPASTGANAADFLDTQTVLSDPASNQLVGGGSGEDWFWISAGDKVSKYLSGAVATQR